MAYTGKLEFAAERKLRERNKPLYRLAHLPIWVWVFFLAPGPLTFSLFARGFRRGNVLWLTVVVTGTGIAMLYGQLPGCEPQPYILRFDEDRPNPLYRRICYTFAWSAALSFALLNLTGLIVASINGKWIMKQLYRYAYFPLSGTVLALGAAGKLPRVGYSTRGEGHERRYFYGTVWAVTVAQTALLVAWKTMPSSSKPASRLKLGIYTGILGLMGMAAQRGLLHRTRPILPGEDMVAD